MNRLRPQRGNRALHLLGVLSIGAGAIIALWLSIPLGELPPEFLRLDFVIGLLTLSLAVGATRWTDYGRAPLYNIANALLAAVTCLMLMGVSVASLTVGTVTGALVLGFRLVRARTTTRRRGKP